MPGEWFLSPHCSEAYRNWRPNELKWHCDGHAFMRFMHSKPNSSVPKYITDHAYILRYSDAFQSLRTPNCLHQIGALTEENGWEWTQSGRCMFSSQISHPHEHTKENLKNNLMREVWAHVAPFYPFFLKRRQVVGLSLTELAKRWIKCISTSMHILYTGRIARWPCNREQRIGTNFGDVAMTFRTWATCCSVLSGDSWNLSLETWKKRT